ncbi:MAG: RNA polymerase sigma factor [Candidatus Latescibacterota bacterium]
MTLAELYRDYEDEVRRRACRLTRDPSAADDLVQDTFVRVLGHLGLLDQLNPHQRRAWLYQTLQRLFLDQRSARLRQAALVARLERESPAWSDPEVEGADQGVLGLLDGADRRLMEMRFVLGLTSRQIGVELGIPAATVRWRIHQVVKKLRACRDRLT